MQAPRVASEYACSTRCSRKRSDAVAHTKETVERWKCDVRENEQRFWKTLGEEVLALAPISVRNRCHLNSHILKSNTQVRTMHFDSCRAQADVAAPKNVPMDLSMLGKGEHHKSKGDRKGITGGGGKSDRGEGGGKEDQKGKGKEGEGKDKY